MNATPDIYTYAVASVGVFAITVILAFILGRMNYKYRKVIAPVHIMFAGTFISGLLIFYPIYKTQFGEVSVWFKSFLVSVHHTIRLFVVDADYDIIQNFVENNVSLAENSTGVIVEVYSILAAVIYIVAPLLTFEFILSFFKNFSAYRRYWGCFWRNIYVFSELNDRSIVLAKSIKKKNKWAAIVFTDVFEKNQETVYELVEEAKGINAICFKKDITSLRFGFHLPIRKLSFISIGYDESENLQQTVKLVNKYGKVNNTQMYIFATCVESELLLSSIEPSVRMKVRRINPFRSFTYDFLYNNGYKILESGILKRDGNKHVSAVVVGLGEHGMEITKALAWMGQMYGYRIKITTFDREENSAEKFAARCPGLLNEKYSSEVYDLPKFTVNVNSGIDAASGKFLEKIRRMKEVTYVFVCMGNDSKNTEIAVKIRSELLRKGIKPIIHAIVYDSEKRTLMTSLTNFEKDKDGKFKKYDIDFIGDMNSIYAEDIVLNSKLEELALERHLQYNKDEESFWKYEYNYRSSMASAIHVKIREDCKIPGAEKEWDECNAEEKHILRVVEHNRWIAYMLGEGYVKGKKNHMAKTHNLITAFHKLPKEEQIKDDVHKIRSEK